MLWNTTNSNSTYGVRLCLYSCIAFLYGYVPSTSRCLLKAPRSVWVGLRVVSSDQWPYCAFSACVKRRLSGPWSTLGLVHHKPETLLHMWGSFQREQWLTAQETYVKDIDGLEADLQQFAPRTVWSICSIWAILLTWSRLLLSQSVRYVNHKYNCSWMTCRTSPRL